MNNNSYNKGYKFIRAGLQELFEPKSNYYIV